MEAWSVHHLSQQAKCLLDQSSSKKLKEYAQCLIRAALPVIFSLSHLAKIIEIDYHFLHASVARRREVANYNLFAIKKRSGGRRYIHAVAGDLMRVQQFVNSEILQKLRPHSAAFAYHSNGGILACASMHCGARWIFKFDLADFFYSINEFDVYKIFLDAGYRPLLAFELARLCTTIRLPKHLRKLLRLKKTEDGNGYKFYNNTSGCIGVLPQGAPTSPMLSNMAAVDLDEELTSFSDLHGLVYTRYADDLTFSTSEDLPNNLSIGKFQHSVIRAVRENGFRENPKKIRIAGPGSKKMVLGLLVDGPFPRLSREMYKRIDRHLHAVQKYGWIEVAEREKFDSVFGFHNHIMGLIAFVKNVDSGRWQEFQERCISLPCLSSR